MAFTNDDDLSGEIRDIIQEMGYDVSEQDLHELEKDLRLIEENADFDDSQIFSRLLKHGADDLSALGSDLLDDEALQDILNFTDSTLTQQTPAARPSKKNVELPAEFDDLISYGYLRLTDVYEEINKYKQLLGFKPEDVKGGMMGKPVASEQFKNQGEEEEANNGDSEDDNPLDKENVQSTSKAIPTRSKKKIDPKEEARRLKEIMRENGICPTKCPEPGRLPFKHDQRLRLEKYRQQWAIQPPPNEQKRMALRWRIREAMLRRDIPHLRLIDEDDLEKVIEVREKKKRQAEQGWKP